MWIMEQYKNQDIVILGASSYNELYDLIHDINDSNNGVKINVIGLLDDDQNLHGKKINGVSITGSLSDWKKFDESVKFVFGIGSHKTHLKRKEIIKNLTIDKNRFISLVHPTVKIFNKSIIGKGCIIHLGSVIFNNTRLEDFCIVMAMTVIGTRNLIGEGCIITSKVSTTNNVLIGSYSFIGTGSLIAESVEISPGTIISLGSVVHKKTSPGDLVFNHTSKKMKYKSIDEEIIDKWSETKKKKMADL